jgi:two-component system response regulator RegA
MTKEVIILDDDQVFADTLARSFTRRGYISHSANTIQDAKEVISRCSIDYAVVDLKIDQESGLHFLALLNELSPHTKAVVLTGYSSIATTVEAMKLGSVNYLCKPATTDVIIKALEDEQVNPDVTLETTPPSVGRLEWEHIQRVLNEHDGNISATANALGMHRRTLQRKLQKRPSAK